MLILFQESVERDIDKSCVKSKIYLTHHLTIFYRMSFIDSFVFGKQVKPGCKFCVA